MDKKKKFWAIALIVTMALALAFVIVYWAIYGKDEVIALFERVKDFINRPLPILGISLVAVAAISFRFLSLSSWGKKAIAEQKREFEEFKKQQEEEKAKAAEEAKKYKDDIKDFVDGLVKKQGISENDLGQVEAFVQKLPFKGAREFHLEHKEKEQ